MTGRIDIHSHLLPGVDDGCPTVEESIACARLLGRMGYTHAFCTPHIWPSFPHNNVNLIPQRTADLQARFDAAGVHMKLLPGGELSLRPEMLALPLDQLVTFNMAGHYALMDFWAESLPDSFWPVARQVQSLGVTLIIAHPERIRAIHADPPVVERFLEAGLLLQGNLQCFSDPLGSSNRTLVERFLTEGRYTFLGSDTHKLETLPLRLDGLLRAIELVGKSKVNELTIDNPRRLLPPDPPSTPA